MGHRPGSKPRGSSRTTTALLISGAALAGTLLGRRSRSTHQETETVPKPVPEGSGPQLGESEDRQSSHRPEIIPLPGKDYNLFDAISPFVVLAAVAALFYVLYMSNAKTAAVSVATEVGQHIETWYADAAPEEELSVRSVGDVLLVGDDVTVDPRGTHIEPVTFAESDRNSWCFEAPYSFFVTYHYSAAEGEAVKGRCPA